MQKIILLICLLLAVIAQAQKPIFQDCSEPACQEEKWQAFYGEVYAEIEKQYPYRWQDSLAIRFTLDPSGALAVQERFTFAAPKALNIFSKRLKTLSDQWVASTDTFSVHLPLLLPTRYGDYPEIKEDHHFPILSNCADYNEAGRLACYHYVLDLVRDVIEEENEADLFFDFALTIYFKAGQPVGLKLTQPTMYPEKVEKYMRSFIATYSELFDPADLAGSDDYQISLQYQNLPFGKRAEKQEQLKKYYYSKSHFIRKIERDTADLTTTYMKYARSLSSDSARLRNQIFLNLLAENDLDHLTSLPYQYQRKSGRIKLDSIKALALGQQSEKETSREDATLSFAAVEQVPVFPGCEDETDNEKLKYCFSRGIMTHVARTFEFPKTARQKGIMGRIYISFVVERDGSISSIKVLRGVHPLLDLEGVRVISLLPKVEPAIQRGKPVRMSFTLPINAKLQ